MPWFSVTGINTEFLSNLLKYHHILVGIMAGNILMSGSGKQDRMSSNLQDHQVPWTLFLTIKPFFSRWLFSTKQCLPKRFPISTGRTIFDGATEIKLNAGSCYNRSVGYIYCTVQLKKLKNMKSVPQWGKVISVIFVCRHVGTWQMIRADSLFKRTTFVIWMPLNKHFKFKQYYSGSPTAKLQGIKSPHLIETLSPTFKWDTPAGVPVKIRSPWHNRNNCDRLLIISGTE